MVSIGHAADLESLIVRCTTAGTTSRPRRTVRLRPRGLGGGDRDCDLERVAGGVLDPPPPPPRSVALSPEPAMAPIEEALMPIDVAGPCRRLK